jgi:hypothetical protein
VPTEPTETAPSAPPGLTVELDNTSLLNLLSQITVDALAAHLVSTKPEPTQIHAPLGLTVELDSTSVETHQAAQTASANPVAVDNSPRRLTKGHAPLGPLATPGRSLRPTALRPTTVAVLVAPRAVIQLTLTMLELSPHRLTSIHALHGLQSLLTPTRYTKTLRDPTSPRTELLLQTVHSPHGQRANSASTSPHSQRRSPTVLAAPLQWDFTQLS